ncbi:unnamed protein product [Paramecium sonneborni]|uniref:THIF-type NAD/FAD binding fold domain-containing protein n=1 Tax=Paramecium sonneborni TaxID=65129 RepID=A0A8S1P4F4_9CILI|nr:unnamed protein product [Paramecium sonneborni]
MVGVGGIGCEVLKMVSKFTFQEFHIIDMDTIEVSNLNHQFLFRLEHRGQSKSLVAAQTMKKMAPQLNIIAHFAAFKSPGYTMDFFRQFDAAIMALDNAETRSYVNKVCHALGIFIVDAGSMGFKGQANAYYEGTVCYDCYPIATTQKQYPACTIRSQPSNCTHCVIWAKYLFTQLFSGEVGILEVEGFDKTQPNSVFSKFFKGQEMPHSIHIVDHQLLYDKEDDLHVLFIYASTALRCRNFNIEQYDYQQIKSISAFIQNHHKIQYFQDLNAASYVSTGKKQRILTLKSAISNPLCNSCFHNQIYTKVDFSLITIVDFVKSLKIISTLKLILILYHVLYGMMKMTMIIKQFYKKNQMNYSKLIQITDQLLNLLKKNSQLFFGYNIQINNFKFNLHLLKFKINHLDYKILYRIKKKKELEQFKKLKNQKKQKSFLSKFLINLKLQPDKKTEILIDQEPNEQIQQQKKVELIID